MENHANLVGLLTGTITGYVKYADISRKEQEHLLKSLKWCYEQAGFELTGSVKEELEKFGLL